LIKLRIFQIKIENFQQLIVRKVIMITVIVMITNKMMKTKKLVNMIFMLKNLKN